MLISLALLVCSLPWVVGRWELNRCGLGWAILQHQEQEAPSLHQEVVACSVPASGPQKKLSLGFSWCLGAAEGFQPAQEMGRASPGSYL